MGFCVPKSTTESSSSSPTSMRFLHGQPDEIALVEALEAVKL